MLSGMRPNETKHTPYAKLMSQATVAGCVAGCGNQALDCSCTRQLNVPIVQLNVNIGGVAVLKRFIDATEFTLSGSSLLSVVI